MDALYTVRQIQAPSPSAPVASPGATGSYFPTAVDLYYNGGNFADAFLRWDNPEWKHDDADCDTRTETKDADCSTYEHDLILEWRNDGGWFAIQRLGTRVPGVGRSFCTTWSDLPDPYDDCPTAGVSPDPGVVELSFGTFKAPLIEPGRDYYGSWRFQHQRGDGSTTSVRLDGQEGEFKNCLGRLSIWCIYGIHHESVLPTRTTVLPTGTTERWSFGTPSYLKYSRP